MGVVARVNGAPIYLRQVEFKNDVSSVIGRDEYNPTIEELRKDYGKALGELIGETLVAQDLKSRGLSVTPEEVQAEEDKVRSDYPEGGFEEALTEEYVDLKAWREQLKARLAMQKFINLVLRPSVTLDHLEAQQYYKDHLADFFLPAQVTFLYISGPNRDLVEKATAFYHQGVAAVDISEKLKHVDVRRLRLRDDRLSGSWRTIINSLQPGQESDIMAAESGFQRLILQQRSPGMLMDLSKAYPVIEKIMIEKKISQAYDTWFANALKNADIKVNGLLLKQKKEEKKSASPRNKELETTTAPPKNKS
ncbi:MAG: peptidyl-prolyl cis-trans isomerase [Desulfovibrio sp.]|uniref:peptidyl-prolyl cis-trans isomerase n=1 Tax=Desulfovibrio sp. 7SRBS1 TaxID=3378064 RepID=UPI003B3F93AC